MARPAMLVLWTLLACLVYGMAVGGRGADAVITSSLPLRDIVTMETELVLSRGTASNRTVTCDYFRFAGDAIAGVPVRIDHMDNGMRSSKFYLTASAVVVVNSAGGCVRKQLPSEPEDMLLWRALLDALKAIDLDDPLQAVLDRGMAVRTYRSSTSLLIPPSIGGLGVRQPVTVTYMLTDSTWSTNYQHIGNHPQRMVLSWSETVEGGTPIAVTLSVTIPLFRTTETNPDFDEMPAVCPSSDVASGTLAQLAEPSNSAPDTLTMPAFPWEFTANIQVIMPKPRKSFTMRESFSAIDRTSQMVVEEPSEDEVGRISSRTWHVDGRAQLSYYFSRSVSPPDDRPGISRPLLDYFWPNRMECTRAVVAFDVVAGSVASLMLYSARVEPIFIGVQYVRGIRCRVWTATREGFRTQWFWADPEYTVFNTTTTSTDTLVRIVVEGAGSAAFFPHHPFFAQPSPFPSSLRARACSTLNPTGDGSCNGYWEDPYYFTYDFSSFTPHVTPKSLELPAECSAGSAVFASFPSLSCSARENTMFVSIVLVIVVIFSMLFSGCLVWCRFAPMVRNLQDDLVDMSHELNALRDEQLRLRSTLPGGDPCVENAAGKPHDAPCATPSPL